MTKVFKEHRVSKEPRAHRVHVVVKEIKDSKVLRALLVLKVHRVAVVRRVTKVFKVLRAKPVQQAHRALAEQRVIR